MTGRGWGDSSNQPRSGIVSHVLKAIPKHMHSKKQISVLIADDHQVFVEGVMSVLQRDSDPGVRVVGQAADEGSMMQMLTRYTPDVLLLDLSIDGEEGIHLIPGVLKKYPAQRIIIMALSGDGTLVQAARQSGAKGFVQKNCSQHDLIQAIREVANGNEYFSSHWQGKSHVQQSLIHGYRRQSLEKFVEHNKLTKRELEVFRLIGKALSNKEIAEQLYISDQTVSVHRKNIMRKLGVNTSAGLVKIAYDNCLI